MKEYMVKMKVNGEWVEGCKPNKVVKTFTDKAKAIDEMVDMNVAWVKYVKQFVDDMGDDLNDFHRLAKTTPSTFGVAERDISEWSL